MTTSTITSAYNSVLEATTSAWEATETLRTQLTDCATETAMAAVHTASGVVGSTLVVTTATRMAAQGFADLTPKSKEEAELLISLLMESATDTVDTIKADVKQGELDK